jgi:arginyl-tRNA synthetase
LDVPEAFALLKILYRFPETVRAAARTYEPSLITRLITDAAQAFNRFYFAHKILTAVPAETSARLKLTEATRTALKKGLYLLLMDAPEQM